MNNFVQKNERRLELLNQRKTRFLTDDEVAELGWLTELVDAALPPRPRLSLEELQTALFAADKTIKALQEDNAKLRAALEKK